MIIFVCYSNFLIFYFFRFLKQRWKLKNSFLDTLPDQQTEVKMLDKQMMINICGFPKYLPKSIFQKFLVDLIGL